MQALEMRRARGKDAADENFRLLLENTLDIAVLLDPQGFVIFASRSVQRFLGDAPEDMVGSSIFERIHPGDLTPALEGFAYVLETGRSGRRLELRLRHRRGHWCVMEVKAAGLTEDGRGIIVQARDLTEEKRLQEEILKVSQEEHFKIAEELHDGLTQDLAAMEFLAKSLENKLKSRSPDLAAESSRMTRLLGQAVKKTRDLARGFYPMELKASGFREALENFFRDGGLQAALDLDYEAGVEIADEVVATHCYYIIREAVLNAVHHGGAQRVSAAVQASAGRLVLVVRDNGRGFSTQNGGQRGIGLRILNHRVRMLNGTLDILRNSAGGTTLICHFPQKPQDPKEKRHDQAT